MLKKYEEEYTKLDFFKVQERFYYFDISVFKAQNSNRARDFQVLDIYKMEAEIEKYLEINEEFLDLAKKIKIGAFLIDLKTYEHQMFDSLSDFD